jgi:conjugative transposon TraN protein
MKKSKRMIFMCAWMLAFAVSSHAQQESSADVCPGARPIPPEHMIAPYALEVSFDKTVHVIFPSPVVYVDLGSAHILAGKAGDAENVLRVKAAVKDFQAETNLSVITGEGSFYSFNVSYAPCPEKLNIEMRPAGAKPEGKFADKTADIYLKALNGESPERVAFICHAIHQADRRHVRHVGSHSFGIRYRLKGIYAHDELLYLHTEIRNTSAVAFDIDFIRMKIVDRKLAKRTAIQETAILPLSVWNEVSLVGGRRTERTVIAISKITLPEDKRLVVELFEKGGGRHQSFTLESVDLAAARGMNKLQTPQP